MIIKEINIQNFKSFGNNKQTIKFDNNGQLILLQGDNGSGKSSLQETIDFSLFGLVRGKEKKRIPQTDLPNRINGSLLTSINFINENNENIKITRGLKPLKFEILKDKNDISDIFRKLDQEKREEIIGMNYDIYKSFISMSLNDFTNFINLDPNTKRKLLNKLFNLEDLDKYYEITKEIIRDNIKNIDKIKIDIENNESTIKTYKDNIFNISKENSNNITKDEIKNEILSKKSQFLELKENIKDLNLSLKEINNNISNRQEILIAKKHKLDKLELKIEDYDNKISIFEKGKCPTCNTILKSDKHIHNLNVFTEDKQKLLNEKIEIKSDIINYKKESHEVYLNKQKLINEIKLLSVNYKNLESDLRILKNEYDNYNLNNKALLEIENNIEKLENKNKELSEIIKNISISNSKYKKLNEIFSISGIRKNIIENTIEPLNNYLSQYLKELESDFRVEINDEFDAEIYERYINKINPESLSNGESRKINMALSLSYLEIIRKVRNSNILFLDEIFASVDSENINILLKSLKKFALKYNINIIVIAQDHSPFDIKHFDRIITIKKNTFSIINDKKNN
jgi:DNA repair exonuclease SbcCD ATPase subunit